MLKGAYINMKVYQYVFDNNSINCKYKVLVNGEKYILDPYKIKSYDEFLSKKIHLNEYSTMLLGDLEVNMFEIKHKNYVVLYC